jgi:hypothetical protein
MDIKTKITALAILAVATCAAAEAPRTVTVCMEATLPVEVLEASQAKASGMFAAIGVKLYWRCPKSRPQGTIVISLGNPKNRNAHELAHALPYEGTHIEIFYDSVRKIMPNNVPAVLAHVMVHEVTHILQGFPRHSDSGIMKAHWDDNDFLQMAWKPLPFTEHDVDLIRRGLDAREARLASARLVASNHVQ